MNKNVLFIIDNLGSGGAQNQLTLLATLLKTKGYNVEVVYYYPQTFYKDRLDKNKIICHYYPKSSKLGISVIFNLVQLINKNKYDAVVSFLNTPNFYNVISCLFSLYKTKTIVSYRSRTNILKLNLFHRIKFNFINKIANKIIFNSFHEMNNWISYYPELSNKSICLYNMVDFDNFKLKGNYKRNNKILVVGSIGPDKNGLLIICALSELLKRKSVTLTWVGQKVLELSERRNYFEEMEFLIIKNNLRDNWNWQEPVKDIANYYHEYDCLILASKVEGLPNVVCEALSCGTPVILSNVLDHPILVQQDVNGFLFDPEEHCSLVNALMQFYGLSDEQYAIMSKMARQRAIELFDKEVFFNLFTEILQ